MNDETIINVLKEMRANICVGCGGCIDYCLDFKVLDYLIKEREGDLSGK